MFAIRFEHIKTVQHDMGNGVTEPKFGTTDDNTPVVIKTFNGPEGILILFNEYFCYRLAILLDIPMPPSGICKIDSDTVIYNDKVTSTEYGYGFYSTHLNKVVTLVDTIIPLIENKEVFYKILLFDHTIFNSDRNLGNLLVQYYKKNITLHVIDHSHVFINQAIWDANCLNRAIEEKDYLSQLIMKNNDALYGMFYRNMSLYKQHFDNVKEDFQAKINEEVLRNILIDMPQEWLPSDKDIDALIKYILYRINHLDNIIATIINYIKE